MRPSPGRGHRVIAAIVVVTEVIDGVLGLLDTQLAHYTRRAE
jgi:hypothetical protein